MSVEAIGIFSLLIGICCLIMGNRATIIAVAVAAVFGSATALSIGSANVLPGHVLLGMLIVGIFTRSSDAGNVLRALHPSKPGFWFSLLLAYGLLGAFLLPRILEGTTQIIPLGTTIYDDTGSTVPLTPVSSNFTQSIYLTCDLLCLIMASAVAMTTSGFNAVLAGLIAYCIANTAFALIDLATFATGTQGLMAFMRNAQYVLHTNDQVGGMKRIAGSFTEASSFARSTLGVLGLSGTLWLCGYKSLLTGTIAGFSVVLLILSTSSTGLVGVPVMLAVLYGTSIKLLGRSSQSRRNNLIVILAPIAALAVCLAIVIQPDLSKLVSNYIDLVVLGKSDSDSAMERSTWNAVSLMNFLDSAGLGVGLGTVRSSSFPVALLANVGLPGVIFYGLFVASVLSQRKTGARSFVSDVQLAARNGCIGLFFGDLLVGPVVDQGLVFYIMAALAATEPGQVIMSEVLPGIFQRQRGFL